LAFSKAQWIFGHQTFPFLLKNQNTSATLGQTAADRMLYIIGAQNNVELHGVTALIQSQ
jgi:hypothetical protein